MPISPFRRRVGRIASFVCTLTMIAFVPSIAPAQTVRPPALLLFQDDMASVVSQMHWRGDKLTEDTVYAAALTGVSWAPFWNEKRQIALVVAGPHKNGGRSPAKGLPTRPEVLDAAARRDWRTVIRIVESPAAPASFSNDPALKEALGRAKMEIGDTAGAFNAWASPVVAAAETNVAEADLHMRVLAWQAAIRCNKRREAVVLALSLLLSPGDDAQEANRAAIDYLKTEGVNLPRVLLGVLEAPDRLPGLPMCRRAASDLLSSMAEPALLPFLLHLANSDDPYLGSRAVLGLGMLAYRARPEDPTDWATQTALHPIKEYGLSTGEQKLIRRLVKSASEDGNSERRAAAAVALALIGTPDVLPVLKKLARDPAFVLDAAPRALLRHIIYPVRLAAAVGLARFGIKSDPAVGDYAPHDLDRMRRGGRDITPEVSGTRRDYAVRISITSVDIAMAPSLRRLR